MHVCLQATGLKVQTSDASVPQFDEASSYVFVPEAARVLSYSLAAPDEQAQATHIGEGPPVAAIAASLDGATLALQRSAAQVQFQQREGPPLVFVQAPQSRAPLLGFFWTRCGDGDFVMVTRSGFELYALGQGRQSLSLTWKHAHPVFWWRYSHAARLLLLGTGDFGLWLQGYQLPEQGSPIKLAPFQISAVTPPGTTSPPASSKLNPSDIWLLVLYGGAYCAYLDRRVRKLHLYRFFLDAVVPQQIHPVPGASVALSTTDNLLVIHHQRTGVALIIDVRASANPIAPPLPLHLSSQGPLHRKSWAFHSPDVVIDRSSGTVMRCSVDIAQVVPALGADPQAAVGFLLRRQMQAHPTADIPTLVVNTLKAALVEHIPLSQLRAVLDEIHKALAGAAASSAHWRPAVTPELLVERVWGWLHAEEATDAPSLQAAVSECAASLAGHGLRIPPALHALAVDIALQQGHGAQVAASLAGQPAAASKQLAKHVQGLATASLPKPQAVAHRLHTTAGSRSEAYHDLLAQGKVIQALRYGQHHHLSQSELAEALATATHTGDMHAVLSALQQGHAETDAARLAELLQPLRHQLPEVWRGRLGPAPVGALDDSPSREPQATV